MWKKLALLTAVLLAIWGVYRVTRPGGRPTAHPEIESDSSPAPVRLVQALDEAAPARTAGVEPRVPVAAPAANQVRPAAGSGSLLVRAQWSDGRPAADIGVTFHIARRALPDHRARRVVTDEEGLARAEGLVPGSFWVESDRGDHVRADVVAGERREARLLIARGVDVEGTVFDAQGRCVPGASIWLTTGSIDWLGGRVVARADADGAFFVRSMPPDQSLGALAPGFAPSELIDLETQDRSSPPVRIELALVSQGGALHVHVLGAGEPVPRALVAVGDARRWGRSRTGGGSVELWTPRTRACDSTGSVLFEGLAPGEQSLEIRADGFAVASGRAEIAAGETTEIEVSLASGVTLSGLILDATRDPVPGAVVRVFTQAVDERFLQTGQFDHYSAFGYPAAVADAQGEYRLDSVAPGTLHLYAGPPRDPGYGPALHVHETRAAEPGTTLVWDVDLVPGPTIAGRVVYSDAAPIPHVFVSTIDEETGARQMATAGEDGRFAFYNLRPTAYTVNVQFWDAPAGAPALAANHVWPDAGELLLEAAFPGPTDVEPGEVRFRFRDTAGRLAHPDGLSFALASGVRVRFSSYERDGDQYVFAELPPGEYKLHALSGEDTIYAGAWFDVRSGEIRDLGTLQTERGGSLEIHLARPVGAEDVEPLLRIRHAASSVGRRVGLGISAVKLVENLSPGAWTVSLFSPGLTNARTEVQVSVGETATVRLAPRRAVARELAIAYPDDRTLQSLHLQVSDDTGHELWNHADAQPSAAGRPYRRTVNLPLGRIHVEVSADGGMSGSLDFEMTSLEPGQPAVRIELR